MGVTCDDVGAVTALELQNPSYEVILTGDLAELAGLVRLLTLVLVALRQLSAAGAHSDSSVYTLGIGLKDESCRGAEGPRRDAGCKV